MSDHRRGRPHTFDWPQFVADVGHELGNLASFVSVVFAGLDTHSGGGGGDARRVGRKPERDGCSERLASLSRSLNEIGFVSRSADIPMMPVALGDVALGAAVAMRKLADRHAVTLSVEGAAGDASCFGAHDLLVRAVSRLVENAIQYSPRGSNVEIRVDAMPRSSRISVVDRGIGIEPGEETQLAKPFFRGRRQLEEISYRVGLGLTVVEVIAARHGGTISLSPNDGPGVTAELNLPNLAQTKIKRGGSEFMRSRRLKHFAL